jgi:RNA polymerase sigma factor (sigma-70 family)
LNSSEKPTFESVAQEYRQPLTRVAYHLCGNLDEACDIVQETLLAGYKGFASLREPEKVASWLYSILRRKAIERRRAMRSEDQLVEEPTAPGPDETEALVRGIILEQMSKLADEDREILAGKYLLGLSYKELAESLGIKEATVRVRSLRSKERLREILRGVGVEVPKGSR